MYQELSKPSVERFGLRDQILAESGYNIAGRDRFLLDLIDIFEEERLAWREREQATQQAAATGK